MMKNIWVTRATAAVPSLSHSLIVKNAFQSCPFPHGFSVLTK